MTFDMRQHEWSEEQPCRILPRHDGGSDWGRDRRCLLDAGELGCVFVWPGHTAWAGLGSQAYYATKVEVQYIHKVYARRSNSTLLEGGRISAARLNADSVRQEIAKRLGIPVEHLPQLHPRKTMVLKQVRGARRKRMNGRHTPRRIHASYNLNDRVKMTDDAFAGYGEKYRGVVFVVTSVSTKYMPAKEFFAKGKPYGYHPGFDDASGGALYDLMDESSLVALPLSLYDYELEPA